HPHRLATDDRVVRGGQDDVADVPAGQFHRETQLHGVDRVGRIQIGHGAQVVLPQPGSGAYVRVGEGDHEMESAGECRIDVPAQIAGQNGDSVETLHPLQQVGHFLVRVTVVRVLDVRPRAEQDVRLVEEQDRVQRFGLGEDAFEVLLRLPDVLGDDRVELDLNDVQYEGSGDDIGRERLAGTRRSGEQGADSGPLALPLQRALGHDLV